MPIEQADLIITLKEKSEWISARSRAELTEKMKEALSIIPGISIEISQPVQLRFNELMTGVRSDVAVKIFGDDLTRLSSLAGKAAQLIGDVEGVDDLRDEIVEGLPQILIRYDFEKISRYGLRITDLNQTIKTALAGQAAGIVYEGERRFNLVVRFGEPFRKDIALIRSIYISLPGGNQVPLEQVADITLEQGPVQVSRESGQRRIVIGLNARERDVLSVINDIRQRLDRSLQLPPGYYITYGGQFENLAHATGQLVIVVPVSLALILILLFVTFGRVKEALLIFSAIPMAAVGGLAALWVRDLPLSISAAVGFIALFGVAVLNGIVLMSQFRDLEHAGIDDAVERVLQGAVIRLRPVLITATVASLGFLPMAISQSAGAEVQRPLATVVIGGLITSTVLTLVVLPVLYVFASKKKVKG